MENKKYRVAQWITGHTGINQLKKIIEHPRLELVGVHVHSEEKIGKDAGDIAGTEKTGVIATNSIEDILAVKPDCVCYSSMTTMANIDEICQFLKNGSNVVTITTDFAFHHPDSLDPEIRQKIEAACEEGNTSLFASGVSPGFVQENLLLAVLGQMRRIDSITIYEFGDMRPRHDSPDMIAMMFGQSPEIMNMGEKAISGMQLVGFGPSLRMIMDAIGMPLDDVTSVTKFPVAKETFTLANTLIEKGKVAAYQGTVAGIRDGKEVIKFCFNWYSTPDLDDEVLPMRDTGWRIVVEGDVLHKLDIYQDPDPVRFKQVQPGYNGNMAVNSIIHTCEAKPGIRTLVDMPLIVPYFS